jgi:predicted lipase
MVNVEANEKETGVIGVIGFSLHANIMALFGACRCYFQRANFSLHASARVDSIPISGMESFILFR